MRLLVAAALLTATAAQAKPRTYSQVKRLAEDVGMRAAKKPFETMKSADGNGLYPEHLGRMWDAAHGNAAAQKSVSGTTQLAPPLADPSAHLARLDAELARVPLGRALLAERASRGTTVKVWNHNYSLGGGNEITLSATHPAIAEVYAHEATHVRSYQSKWLVPGVFFLPPAAWSTRAGFVRTQLREEGMAERNYAELQRQLTRADRREGKRVERKAGLGSALYTRKYKEVFAAARPGLYAAAAKMVAAKK